MRPALPPGQTVGSVGGSWRAWRVPADPCSAFDLDSDQTVVDTPDPALARRIAELLDAVVSHPWIGRQPFGLFQRVGLRDVRVLPHVNREM